MAPLPIEVDLDGQVDVTTWNGTAVSSPATAGIPDVNVKNINNTAAATPGASGGILISGSNSGTTTLGALTVTGAVSFGSTFGVTGTVTFNAFTVTNAFTVSGATTFTGAITASNASNNIVGIDVAKVSGSSTAADNMEVVFATDFATNYNTTDDGWVVKLGDYAHGGVSATFELHQFDINDAFNVDTFNPAQIAVSGTTTFTGAITATNASNDLRINGAVPGAAGGLFIAGTNAATTVTTSFTTTFTGDLTGSVGSVVGAVGSVTGAVGSVTGNVGGNVTGTIGGLAAGAVTDVEDAVWDAVLADHLDSGSTGAALNAAGSSGDPWATTLPGAYGAGTAGNILGNNLDAAITTRMASYTQPTGFLAATFPSGTVANTTNITAGTITTVSGNVTGSVGSVVGAVGSVTGNVGGNVTGTVGGIAGTTQTLDALQTALNSAHGSGSWATATGFATSAQATTILSKTNSLTFTVAGQVDSNIQYVNDVQVTGAGTSGNPWGPV